MITDLILGKDLVRVCRVVRDNEQHHVAEYTVRGQPQQRDDCMEADKVVLLEGDIETSYTKADNSCVVATDTSESSSFPLESAWLTTDTTVKNTVNGQLTRTLQCTAKLNQTSLRQDITSCP